MGEAYSQQEEESRQGDMLDRLVVVVIVGPSDTHEAGTDSTHQPMGCMDLTRPVPSLLGPHGGVAGRNNDAVACQSLLDREKHRMEQPAVDLDPLELDSVAGRSGNGPEHSQGGSGHIGGDSDVEGFGRSPATHRGSPLSPIPWVVEAIDGVYEAEDGLARV